VWLSFRSDPPPEVIREIGRCVVLEIPATGRQAGSVTTCSVSLLHCKPGFEIQSVSVTYHIADTAGVTNTSIKDVISVLYNVVSVCHYGFLISELTVSKPMRFQVLTAASMKMTGLLHRAVWSDRCFRGAYCLHHRPDDVGRLHNTMTQKIVIVF
jgi:hypothetical protein